VQNLPQILSDSSPTSSAPNVDVSKVRYIPEFRYSNLSKSRGIPVCDTKETHLTLVHKLLQILKFQEELQNKKQEVYDLLAKVERDRCYMPATGRVILDRVRNVKLLQILSADVKPKPSDLV
jgi:hypothetical protein